MKAIILVGGQGMRLRPLTYCRHKSLVPVLNRPFLDWVLGWLGEHGIEEVILAIGVQNEDLAASYPPGDHCGLRVSHAMESTRLESGGAIRQAAAGINETFLVMNGDIFADFDLSAMLAMHRKQAAEVTISLAEVGDPSQFGVVARGPDGFINRFVEKPAAVDAPSSLANAGVWLFEASALAGIPAGAVRVEETLFPALAREGKLLGFEGEGLWFDVGDSRRYLELNLALLGQRVAHCPGCRNEIGSDVRLGGLFVKGSVIGDGTSVGCEALVEASVIWRRVRICGKAEVVRSVIADDVFVGEGAVVVDCVVGARAHLGPRVRLQPGTMVEPDAVVLT